MKPLVLSDKQLTPRCDQRSVTLRTFGPSFSQLHIPTAAELDKVNVNRRFKRPWARKCYYWKPNWIPTEKQHLYLSHIYSMFSSRLAADVEREMAAHTVLPTQAATAVRGDRLLEGEVALLGAFTHIVPVETEDGSRFNVHFVAHKTDAKGEKNKVWKGKDEKHREQDAFAISVFLEEVAGPISSATIAPMTLIKTKPTIVVTNQVEEIESQSSSANSDTSTAAAVSTVTSTSQPSAKSRSVIGIEQGAMELFAVELVAALPAVSQSSSSAQANSNNQLAQNLDPTIEIPEMEQPPQTLVPNSVPLLSLFFPLSVNQTPTAPLAEEMGQPQTTLSDAVTTSNQMTGSLTATTSSVQLANSSETTAAFTSRGSGMTYFFNNKRPRFMPLIHDPLTPDPE